MLLYWEFGSVKVWLRHKRLFGNHTNTTIWRFTWARQKLKSHATNRQRMLITILAIFRKLYCTALHQEWQLCHGYYCLALKSAYKILPKSLVRMNILGAQGIFGVRFTRLEHLGASAIRGCRQHAISLFLYRCRCMSILFTDQTVLSWCCWSEWSAHMTSSQRQT